MAFLHKLMLTVQGVQQERQYFERVLLEKRRIQINDSYFGK